MQPGALREMLRAMKSKSADVRGTSTTVPMPAAYIHRAERLAVLGQLAAGLAHEIRNPLGAISGSVELVRDAEALGAEDKKLLGTVLGELDDLDDLEIPPVTGPSKPPGGMSALERAFADRHARHNNNEFFEAVFLAQLKNSTQVHIGFTCTCFHLYRKIHSFKGFFIILNFID